MGSLDSRGVWKYDNNDHVTPLATFMNLLANSVSNALAALRTDVTISDTGWVNIPLTSPWVAVSGETPQIRRFGPIVICRGAASRSATTGNVSIATLPTGSGLAFAPGSMVESIGYAGSGAIYRGTLSTTGSFAANNFSGTTFRFSLFHWMV